MGDLSYSGIAAYRAKATNRQAPVTKKTARLPSTALLPCVVCQLTDTDGVPGKRGEAGEKGGKAETTLSERQVGSRPRHRACPWSRHPPDRDQTPLNTGCAPADPATQKIHVRYTRRVNV